MKRLLVAAAIAFLAGIPLASADGTPASDALSAKAMTPVAASNLLAQCAVLDVAFDVADATHNPGPHYDDALTLRAEGVALCSSNLAAGGVKYLSSALKIVEAQPSI